MPIIETKGAASAQGFGLFSGKKIIPDGTKGIFNIGVCLTTRNRYTFACDTNAVISGFPVYNYVGAGAGNTTKIIFANGKTPCTPACFPFTSNRRNTYTYATCAASPAPNFPQRAGLLSAAGNSTRGIFSFGIVGSNPPAPSTTRSKFTYACCTSSPAASASAASPQGSAAGNSTRGMFKLGNEPQTGPLAPRTGYSITFNKYTYACDTSTAVGVGTARFYSRLGMATGNATRGIFQLGNIGTEPAPLNGIATIYVCKYTYACDTRTAGTNSPFKTSYGAAAGNSTRGIIAAGYSEVPGCCGPSFTFVSSRYKYTYASDTTSSATSASTPSGGGSAASFASCVNT